MRRVAVFYIGMACVGGVIGYFWNESLVGCRVESFDEVGCYTASTTASLTWIAIGALAGLLVAGLLHLSGLAIKRMVFED